MVWCVFGDLERTKKQMLKYISHIYYLYLHERLSGSDQKRPSQNTLKYTLWYTTSSISLFNKPILQTVEYILMDV